MLRTAITSKIVGAHERDDLEYLIGVQRSSLVLFGHLKTELKDGTRAARPAREVILQMPTEDQLAQNHVVKFRIPVSKILYTKYAVANDIFDPGVTSSHTEGVTFEFATMETLYIVNVPLSKTEIEPFLKTLDASLDVAAEKPLML